MPPGGVGALMMAGMVEGEGVKVSEDDARRELCIAARQYKDASLQVKFRVFN